MWRKKKVLAILSSSRMQWAAAMLIMPCSLFTAEQWNGRLGVDRSWWSNPSALPFPHPSPSRCKLMQHTFGKASWHLSKNRMLPKRSWELEQAKHEMRSWGLANNEKPWSTLLHWLTGWLTSSIVFLADWLDLTCSVVVVVVVVRDW